MSQTQQIINYLTPPGRKITSLQALNRFGCFRLASRAQEIAKLGKPIKSRMIYNKKTKKKYAEYYFA